MAGPVWMATFVAKQNLLSTIEIGNDHVPNWELITHATVIDDRRKNFAKPAGAFKTLHFWRSEPDEKREPNRMGFALASCKVDVHGRVEEELERIYLKDAAFVIAGSTSGLTRLLQGGIPHNLKRIATEKGGDDLTIHCARIVDDDINPTKWETHTLMVIAPRAWWQADKQEMIRRGWVELKSPATQVTLTELVEMLPVAKASAGEKIKVKKKYWSKVLV
jgi:hypothetical protein